MKKTSRKSYAFKFQYRKTEKSMPEIERFFIEAEEKNAENACEIAMLQYLEKHNYYSGKLISVIAL